MGALLVVPVIEQACGRQEIDEITDIAFVVGQYLEPDALRTEIKIPLVIGKVPETYKQKPGFEG